MRNVRVLGIIGLAAIGLTAAACGGSSGPKATAGSNRPAAEPAAAEPAAAKPSGGLNADSVRKDPCQLVTKPEAEAIFGRRAEMPTKGMAVGVIEATCDYAVEATRPSEVRTMTLSMAHGSNGKRFMENARNGAPELGLPVETVAGLGDEAFCLGSDPGASIFFRSGDIVMTVGGSYGDCAVARQFAEKAIARL